MNRVLLMLAAFCLTSTAVAATAQARDHDRHHDHSQHDNHGRYDDRDKHGRGDARHDYRGYNKPGQRHDDRYRGPGRGRGWQSQKAFHRLDRNNDGIVGHWEWRYLYDSHQHRNHGRRGRLTRSDRMKERFFHRADRNNDGRLSPWEFRRGYYKHNGAVACGF